MTPQEIRGLKAGDWITFTPTIWSDPFEGKITAITPEGIIIHWDDDHLAVVKPEQLHSSKFQPWYDQ